MNNEIKKNKMSEYLDENLKDLEKLKVTALKSGLDSIYIKTTKTVE